ncbi:MAG TPA: sterol desaturase family protein [Candidatus Dormibacteraeota bacterium]|nr:sterol desaturase family protein [Candidatus Dormibacteraeota bacterium]
MQLTAGDYEIGAFLACVLVFDVSERLWPARPVDRLRDLKLDALSFVFALAVNRACNLMFRSFNWDLVPQALATPIAHMRAWPSAYKLVLALFIVDFLIYWIHRAQHRFGLLWRTHAWHHSIEQMYWFAGFRTSFFHSFIYNIPQVVVPVTLFHLSPAEAGVGYSLGLLIQFWEHTNLDVNVGPLKYLIITPAYHRIHHSATLHRGKNLGTTFSLWDRMFGTYVDPADVPEIFPMGLGEPVPSNQLPRMLMGV